MPLLTIYASFGKYDWLPITQPSSRFHSALDSQVATTGSRHILAGAPERREFVMSVKVPAHLNLDKVAQLSSPPARFVSPPLLLFLIWRT